MKKQIWKYVLNKTSDTRINIPCGHEILTVKMQGESLCLWVLVNPKATKEEEIFEAFATGEGISFGIGTSREYVATFFINGGAYVGHVFRYTGM